MKKIAIYLLGILIAPATEGQSKKHDPAGINLFYDSY